MSRCVSHAMTRKQRAHACWQYFQQNATVAETELHYETPFQLLVAVILSAQCTDKRVNSVTPALFKAFPTPQQMAASTAQTLLTHIASISYPNNKAQHLLQTARLLVKEHKSEVPQQVEQLLKLPGVGRKTAHVVASILYKAPVLAVDTHVFRVAKRIGLSKTSSQTPLAVEKDLCEYLPKPLRPKAHHWLILHGRYVCTARKPKCNTCPLSENICAQNF